MKHCNRYLKAALSNRHALQGHGLTLSQSCDEDRTLNDLRCSQQTKIYLSCWKFSNPNSNGNDFWRLYSLYNCDAVGEFEAGLLLRNPTQKNHLVFLKAHLKKTIKPTFYFLFEKICFEVKNKIGRTLVQLTSTFFNQTNWTAMKFEGFEKKNKLSSL